MEWPHGRSPSGRRRRWGSALGRAGLAGLDLGEEVHDVPLSAHPSVSADFLTKAGSGHIHMLDAIERLDGNSVHLTDGTSVEADVIVCATGNEMKFPFFDDA